MKTRSPLLALALLMAAATALAEDVVSNLDNAAAAQTFTVTTTADTGVGSLRQAVADANANPGADIIVFVPEMDGQTITLTTGHLLLTDDVTIDASTLPGGISISGNANANSMQEPGESRIFEVPTGKVVVLRALRLIKGQDLDGGAILSKGNLTLDRCLVADCRADLGGGIAISGGTLTITQSTLSGNYSSRDGGWIAISGGTLTITQSTLSGNYSSRDGGGIDISGGTLTITQSTLSGNSAQYVGGGILFAGSGSVAINQSTLSGNSATNVGGGILSAGSGSIAITRSIVAGNLTGGDIDGPFTNNGNNLLVGDPQLAPLGDYGGPTQTMPPLPGSPALDAGGRQHHGDH